MFRPVGSVLVAFILCHTFIYNAYLDKYADMSQIYRILYFNIPKGKPYLKKYILYQEIHIQTHSNINDNLKSDFDKFYHKTK
jgi:hypothetical protein